MKKLCVLLVACASFALAKNVYSDKVLPLYFEKESAKEVGRLLPSNPFEVLKTDGNKVLVKISGFVNPQAPSVLYFGDGQRIMVASFAKNNPPELKNVIKGKEGKWDKANIEVWTDKSTFVENTNEMFLRAKTTYMENCGICHTAHPEGEFTANQWPATFNGMVTRTGIAKEDRWLIIQYLQKNSKDFKKGGK